MKILKISLVALLTICSAMVFSQKDYPEQDTDYSSTWEEDYRGEGYIAYSYYLENLSDEPIIFYNFKVKPNEDRYEILQSYPKDILIIYPSQKTSYLQVKVYTQGPSLTWNSKFGRITNETSSFPQQNKDYVYYWKSDAKSDGLITYSYHLKNISDRIIKFYDFTLTNNGGIYYLVDNLLQKPVIANPGESIQVVKYNFKSGETPSVNWYADWSSFSSGGDAFCDGVNKILEAAKDSFESVKGALKKGANDTDTYFDLYYCTEHIDGVNNEAIEDLLFFWQYSGYIGSSAPLNVINSRFYEYKSKIETCLPNFPERKKDEEEKSDNLKVEYEAEVDYLMHYLRLEVVHDDVTSNYQLEFVIEEVY
jgi:hypothetical protein